MCFGLLACGVPVVPIDDGGSQVDAGGTGGGSTGGGSAGGGSAQNDAGPIDSGTMLVDAGVRTLRSDDEILVDVSTVTAIPGLLQCLTVSVLHADGRRDPIVAGNGLTASINSAAPAVVVGASAGDCEGVGLFFMGVGTALPQVRVTDGTLTLNRSVDVTVLAGALTMGVYNQMSVGQGTVGQLWYAFDARATNMTPLTKTAVPVPRLLVGTFATPGIAELLGPGGYKAHLGVRGLAVGMSDLQLKYEFGTTSINAPLAKIVVVPQAALTSISLMSIHPLRGPESFSKFEANSCNRVEVLAYYGSAGGSYSVLQPPTTLQLVGTDGTISTTDASSVCVGVHGEVRFSACLNGLCKSIGVPFFADADLISVNVVAATPLELASSTTAVDLCLPVTATATFSDHSTRDLFADWSTSIPPLISAQPWATFTRRFNGMTPIQTAEGYPCVTVSAFSTSGSTKLDRLSILWGGHGTNGSPQIQLTP